MDEVVEICCREGRNEDESYRSVSWVGRVSHRKVSASRTCHGVMTSIN